MLASPHAAVVPPGIDIPVSDWQRTPASVCALVQSLSQRVDKLEARLRQDSTTSHRPPSTDSPYHKKPKATGEGRRQKVGGQPGYPGHRQRLLAPIDLQLILPPACSCGYPQGGELQPYYTHQGIELSAVQMDVTHLVLHQGLCPCYQQWRKAALPPEHATDYGLRLTALIDAWQGILGSDGYGVYQSWVRQRQTCLAHLIRTARSLAGRSDPALASCGTWALAELQRLCHMAPAPPTGGEWRA